MIAPPGVYFSPWLSPDEKRVAVSRLDLQGGLGDVWLIELARSTPTRFTFDPAHDTNPIWSPDGSSIVFGSTRDGPTNLYQRAASGSGNDEVVLKSDHNKDPNDWSADGKFILYQNLEPKTSQDLWVLPLSGDQKPFPFLQTAFVEFQGQFSPDGKWIAYTSNESGTWQVYVQSFPASGGKWQVSTAGGAQARWRRDQKELFYISPERKLMAVEVTANSSTFEPGVPKALFEMRIPGLPGSRNFYVVAVRWPALPRCITSRRGNFDAHHRCHELDGRPETMTLSAGTKLGRYEIRSQLGVGGMGEVYLARDTRLERTVALKILPADVAADRNRMSRFEQEAKAASALNHPNIITIYEIDQGDSIYFIATEFIDGETLRQRMKSKPLKLGEVLDIAEQIAAALSAAHAVGIVHRDIKPENIMLRRDGPVKVLDFGLAKLTERPDSIDTEAPTSFKTDPGTVMGTAVYMSPEQARGSAVDARTDTFSLGVVVYEMVAGRLPFEGSTSSEVMASILNEREPQPLARYSTEVPAELERIVSKGAAQESGRALPDNQRHAARFEESEAGVGVREKT